jgi:Protein of unknown function (DUF551)
MANVGDWISVKDELPEMDALVMVCYPDYAGHPRYSWGARVDEGDGWLWAIACANNIDVFRDTSWNVEADDDYRVQFWKPLDPPPPVEKEPTE